MIKATIKATIQAIRLGALAAGLSAAACVGSAFGQPTLTLIGDSSGPLLGTTLLDVAADGSVAVGIRGDSTWRWTPSGLYENLGGDGGFACIANDASRIVSSVLDENFPNLPTYPATSAPAIWQGGTNWLSIGGFGPCDGTTGWCRDTNADGSIIVGGYWIGSCRTNGYVWRQSTGIVRLREYFALGGSAVANATSADGRVIVGFNNGNGPGGRTGVFWVNNGNATLLNNNITIGEVQDVTPDGVLMIGQGHPTTRGAYLYNRITNTFTDLGTLPGIDASSHIPLAVNRDATRIVGFAGGGIPFIWIRDAGMRDFREYLAERNLTLPAGGSRPTCISPDGRFIGGWSGTSPFDIQGWLFDEGARRCVADFDDGSGTGTPDGGVTIDDLLYYVLIYSDGNVRADVDNGTFTGTPDGGVTIDDLLYYLVRYSEGC